MDIDMFENKFDWCRRSLTPCDQSPICPEAVKMKFSWMLCKISKLNDDVGKNEQKVGQVNVKFVSMNTSHNSESESSC